MGIKFRQSSARRRATSEGQKLRFLSAASASSARRIFAGSSLMLFCLAGISHCNTARVPNPAPTFSSK